MLTNKAEEPKPFSFNLLVSSERFVPIVQNFTQFFLNEFLLSNINIDLTRSPKRGNELVTEYKEKLFNEFLCHWQNENAVIDPSNLSIKKFENIYDSIYKKLKKYLSKDKERFDVVSVDFTEYEQRLFFYNVLNLFSYILGVSNPNSVVYFKEFIKGVEMLPNERFEELVVKATASKVESVINVD